MRKTRPVQSSNWTSNLNDEEMELGSRVTLVRRKTKKKTRDESDVDNNSSEKSIPYDDPSQKEKMESPPKVFNKRRLRKSDNIKSTDLDSFDAATSAPKSIDVVVDVHREYKGEKSQKTSKESNESKTDKSPQRLEDAKIISRKHILHDRTNERPKNPSTSHRLQKLHDEAKIADSLDSIKEFQEPTTDERRKDGGFQSFEEKPRGRRQWEVPESVHQVENVKKPPRKRWSKDTSVIRLPEVKSMSSTTSSTENLSPVSRNSEKPVPLPRSSVKEESLFGFDNAAFVSENEDVLRVETDHDRENTKIEMRKITDRLGDIEIFSSSNESQRGSSRKRDREKGISGDTVISMEASTESEDDFDDRNFEKSRNNTVIDIENSENSDENGSSSREKVIAQKSRGNSRSVSRTRRDSVDSNASQSLEEVDEKSNNSSDQELLENERSWTNRKVKKPRKERGEKIEKHSSHGTHSTYEDDDLDEDRSRKARFEDESTVSITETRKSRLEKDHGRKKREKRRDSRKDETTSSAYAQDSNFEENTKKTKKKKKKKKEKNKDVKYISITIHRADVIETDYITKHPMVKVHIVEAETGKYLKSSQEDAGSVYLQPMITGKFDFKENRSMIPIWEEELIFEHDFDALLKTESEQVVVLFEIIDLLSFAEASFNYDKFGNEGCWYKVAWAFLKPVGRNNTLHTDKKVRLQLYRPRRNVKKIERGTCEVYNWWKLNSREKYPCSLFVTVTSVDPPKLEPVFYQQLSLYDLSDVRSESQKASTRTSDSINLPKWTRLAAQSCKIPNKKFFETEISENGCFYVAFSNDGKYLACVLSEEYDYPIVVYEVEVNKIHVQFSGHKTFIYSLNWSNDDNHVLSVSSDQTARIWDVQNQIVQHIEMMPHPSYVYCGKFSPGNSSIVATGCYDRVARIWIKDKKSKNHDLTQELEGHEGFVNSMCFQKDGGLITADSVGIIIVWMIKKNRRTSSRKEWHISRKIKVREIEGVTINTIVLHPLESRILVHSRNNGLRMLDLATGVVLQKYTELNNQRIQSAACISPCGGLIFCGGEDSSLNVWNLETGKYLAKYTIERNYRAVTCVDYHPYDHVLVFSTFGSPAPVRILKFDKDATGDDVGLKFMEGGENRGHSSDVTMSHLNISLASRERSRSSSRKRTPEDIFRDRNLQSSRSQKSLSHDTHEHGDVPEKNERYENAKLKLQRLNETEQSLKSRSTNRLYNIIEKIDRILSNTSRSSGDDLESGRNSALLREAKKDVFLVEENEATERLERRSRKSRSSTNTNIEDHSGSYFESSTSSSAKNELLEMKSLRGTRKNDLEAKKRSRSAKESRARRILDDDLSKTLSDSAANSRRLRVHDEMMKTMQQGNAESSFVVQSMSGDNRSSNSSVPQRGNKFSPGSSSSMGSDGTYVVEKADVERNNDRSSVKMSENEVSLHSDGRNDFEAVKMSESEVSISSNATFTIANEIPIPKPRRKKSLIN